MLGSVLDNRDFWSQRHEKVNASICARRTTDDDLASVIADKKEKKRKTERSKMECTSVTVVFLSGPILHA